MGREGLQGWVRCVGDETDCSLEASKGIKESRAQTLGGGGCGVLVEDEDSEDVRQVVYYLQIIFVKAKG